MKEINKNLTIFMDESGTLPDPRDEFIVICAVYVKNLKEGRSIISRSLETLRKTKKPIKEIKFYYAGQNTKRQFLSAMVASHFEVFVMVIDKKKRKIADTPENFSLLAADLIGEIFLWHKAGKIDVVIDRHFSAKADIEKFNAIVRSSIKDLGQIRITHEDSQKNLLVNTADMVAGSVLWKYTNKDSQFYNIIKENILFEKIVSWPEIKRKTKIPLEPV